MWGFTLPANRMAPTAIRLSSRLKLSVSVLWLGLLCLRALAQTTTITSSGTWTVPPGVTSVSGLVVGGGGGGGADWGGGGGGGQVVVLNSYAVTPGTVFSITIGNGGAGGIAFAASGASGGSTTFGSITAIGGGAGANGGFGGVSGGSGGGAGGNSIQASGSSTVGQGHGGTSAYGAGGAGGGGATAHGSNGYSWTGGNGGAGYFYAGSYYAAGGGGGAPLGWGNAGGPGSPGAGAGAIVSGAAGGNAAANSGSGGGGGCYNWGPGGNGGSGVVILSYATPPQITSSLSQNVSQGQPVSYQITATSAPTGYGATNLPAGLSVNNATGVISGILPTNGGVPGSNSTTSSIISATNALGTDTKTLVWNVTAAAISTSASVSPSSILTGGSVALTRAGSTNFGFGWTENVIWNPDGSAQVLGNQALGSQSYTPTGGVGLYWYQFRLVDTYSNYKDQWISFSVAQPAPSSFQTTSVQSYSVAFSWSGVSGAVGYNVYRNGVKVNDSLISGTSFTDLTATPGTAYTYTVRSVASGGAESPDSTGVSVITFASFEVFTPLP